MTRHKARKGFNLIEAAIVLAVVGAVIGGIWVAAATVSYNYQKQQFLQGFLTIQRLADKYLSQSLPCTTDLMYPGMGGWFLKNESPAVYKLPDSQLSDLNLR